MLVTKKRVLKTVTHKVEINILKEFRKLCKEHKITQSNVIEKAMIKAIAEIKALKDDKNDK